MQHAGDAADAGRTGQAMQRAVVVSSSLLQAEQLFLSSSEPRAALEMRKDLLQV